MWAHYSYTGPATKKGTGVLLPLETTPSLPNHDCLMKTLQPPMTIQVYAAIPHTAREAHAPPRRGKVRGHAPSMVGVTSLQEYPSIIRPECVPRPPIPLTGPSPRARQVLLGSRLPGRGSTSPASHTGHTQVMLSRIRAYVPAKPRSCTFSPCSPRKSSDVTQS